MKEYEYIAYGIENYLVDELVEVICQENLESRPYPDGFRRIFDNYRRLRERYSEITAKLDGGDFSEEIVGNIMDEFSEKQKHFLEAFLNDMDCNYPKLGVRELAEEYQRKAKEGNPTTTERRICIYPYIILQARHYEENCDGTKN